MGSRSTVELVQSREKCFQKSRFIPYFNYQLHNRHNRHNRHSRHSRHSHCREDIPLNFNESALRQGFVRRPIGLAFQDGPFGI